MIDRVPTEVLDNGAIRYGVYDSNGQLLRYEYIKPEDAPTQEGTPLNKANLFSDDLLSKYFDNPTGNESPRDAFANLFSKKETLLPATSALYGLGTDAVPDDVFAWLGKYNQYWWKKRVYVETSGYEEKQTAASDLIYLQYTSSTTTSRTIEYADSIAIDQSTGAVSLKNPSTVKVSYQSSASTLKNLLAGKYITNAHTSPSKIFYIKTDIGTSASSTVGQLSVSYVDDYYYVRITALGLLEITSQTVDTSTIGDWSYLQSSDRNAYPDSGITDGYEYLYLGKPYENFVNLPMRIETGSYTGTGTNGSDNPNTLTFLFVPQIVFIVEDYGSNSAITGFNAIVHGQTNSNGVTYSSYLRWSITWSSDGTSVSWYAYSGTAEKQMNTSSRTYRYVAIG